MGTHPIFESDFDCLTEIYSAENMKVLKQSALGDSSTLYIGEELVPEIENNELLVKIEYSALNRADIMMREGRYPNQKLPRPIGLEGAGRVTKIGKATKGFAIGDRVMCLFPGGGHAEYKNINFKHVLRIPDNIKMSTAGGIMEVWLAAFQLLYKV